MTALLAIEARFPFWGVLAFGSLLHAACAPATPPSSKAPEAPIASGASVSASPGTHHPRPEASHPSDEASAAALIDAPSIAGPMEFLASDLLEGRAPGSRGDEFAIRYIASEFASMGLRPGADAEGKPSFLQKVPLVGVTSKLPPAVSVSSPKGSLAIAVPADLVVMSGVQDPKVTIPPSDVVFVGYGIVAPEYDWDDYKDVDVRGKVVLVMNSDPESDPKIFGGPTRLWYGRWDYKYLQAAKKGASGVLLIHTDHSAAYPWHVVVSSNAKEKFELPPAPGQPRTLAKMWISDPAAIQLALRGGANLDALRKSAESREFRPVVLSGVRFGMTFTNAVRTIESANVLGLLPGADPAKASEVVIYTAHHDHLGMGVEKTGKTGKSGEDVIYNGAVDNASGVAALVAIARAAARGPRPLRSMLFLAVAAEEQGLLGSEWYAQHPTFPPAKIAADLNMDSMNVHGQTNDVGYIGFGKSSLDRIVEEIARAQGRTVHGDAFPDRGSFYRSDQFSFAKIGVPSIYAGGGPSFRGKPEGYGKEVVEAYEKTHYHQPSDEFDPTWDLSGAVEDARLLFLAGQRIANEERAPTWNEGDEFAKLRSANGAK